MTAEPTKPPSNKWRRRFFLLGAAWLITTVLMSFSPVRGIVALPLYVNDAEASGDVAYVMADGVAYFERLVAASDLFHLKRVSRIMILEENESSGYNFIDKKSDSRFERTVDYLANYGVPGDCIVGIPKSESPLLGSLSEAQGLAKHYPDLKSIVVVTSAPHTRRSLLCFQRSFPKTVQVQVYSASKPQDSSEITSPIWIEYVKLVVYLVVA